MSCQNCYTKIRPDQPFTENIKIPYGSDVVIKLPAIEDGVAFDWSSGTLTMYIFDTPSVDGDTQPIHTIADARFVRSQTDESAADPAVTWDDVVTVALPWGGTELGSMEFLTPYYYKIIFDHTSLDIGVQLGRGKLIKDDK